jgi:hypothetical protein
MVCGNTNEKQEMMKKVAGPSHYPLVHGVFLHKNGMRQQPAETKID